VPTWAGLLAVETAARIACVKILIVGGSIFLGRRIVEAALARGHEVGTFSRGRHHPAAGCDESAPVAAITPEQLKEAEAMATGVRATARTYGPMYGALKALCERAAETSWIMACSPGMSCRCGLRMHTTESLKSATTRRLRPVLRSVRSPTRFKTHCSGIERARRMSP
jgi:NAD(P)-dependent dehydrogenase (short-subunit alcohol dehydrogenase family)